MPRIIMFRKEKCGESRIIDVPSSSGVPRYGITIEWV
jgi:hypothetical protein